MCVMDLPALQIQCAVCYEIICYMAEAAGCQFEFAVLSCSPVPDTVLPKM